MKTNLLPNIHARYWGYMALAAWISVALFLFRQDPYNLSEGAARALLLDWSIADQLANSAVTFGTPDLRILLYLPTGYLWTGNVFAAKVLTTLLFTLTAWLLYTWSQQRINPEVALLATGLLLISPITLIQIDNLSPGAYLLPAFALGAWLNNAYRATPRLFGGWYFAQLFVCAFSVTLHPAGLAYPLALAWSWHKTPLDQKQQKYFFTGIGLTVLLALIIKQGWGDLTWLQNPIKSLALTTFAPPTDSNLPTQHWGAGIVLLALLSLIVLKQYRNIWSDVTGRTLLIGLAIGATIGDQTWGLIALCIILYFGLPLILRSHQAPSGGPIYQRGPALLLIFVFSTLSMLADRRHYEAKLYEPLPGQDLLIQILADEAEANRKAAEELNDATLPRLRVASQWPARTMIACKCDTLPLPPATKEADAQPAMLKGITHLIFNPRDPSNIMLARNLSVLGGSSAETIALQPEGVLLHFKNLSPSQGSKP